MTFATASQQVSHLLFINGGGRWEKSPGAYEPKYGVDLEAEMWSEKYVMQFHSRKILHRTLHAPCKGIPLREHCSLSINVSILRRRLRQLELWRNQIHPENTAWEIIVTTCIWSAFIFNCILIWIQQMHVNSTCYPSFKYSNHWPGTKYRLNKWKMLTYNTHRHVHKVCKNYLFVKKVPRGNSSCQSMVLPVCFVISDWPV